MNNNWQAHVTVAVIVEHEGKFLLVEEETLASHLDVYNQPAGHVEQGETLIEAAKREALEETGFEVEPTALLGLYTHTLDELIASERARSPLVIQCIKDYLNGQSFPLSAIYEHPTP